MDPKKIAEEIVQVTGDPPTSESVKAAADIFCEHLDMDKPAENFSLLRAISVAFQEVKEGGNSLGLAELSKESSSREKYGRCLDGMHAHAQDNPPVYAPNGEYKEIVQGVIDRIETPSEAADLLVKHLSLVSDYRKYGKALERGKAILKEVWLGIAAYNQFYEGEKTTIAWRGEITAFLMKKPAVRHFFHAAYGTKKGMVPFDYDILHSQKPPFTG
jgi:hypothetical protein